MRSLPSAAEGSFAFAPERKLIGKTDCRSECPCRRDERLVRLVCPGADKLQSCTQGRIAIGLIGFKASLWRGRVTAHEWLHPARCQSCDCGMSSITAQVEIARPQPFTQEFFSSAHVCGLGDTVQSCASADGR